MSQKLLITGATGFASIAFGYPNALWGEPQTPGIEIERRVVMFIAGCVIGMVFGSLAGVFTMCMVTAAKRADEQRAHLLSGEGQSRKKIRFVDGNNQELFVVWDGAYIQMTAGDGERQISRCQYEDRNHVRIDGQLWQMQEFAKQMEVQGIFYTPVSG